MTANKSNSIFGAVLLLRIYTALSVLAGVLFFICGVIAFYRPSLSAMSTWTMFGLSAMFFVLTYAYSKLCEGLQKRMEWAWLVTVILCVMSITSIILTPFTIYALVVLFRPAVRESMVRSYNNEELDRRYRELKYKAIGSYATAIVGLVTVCVLLALSNKENVETDRIADLTEKFQDMSFPEVESQLRQCAESRDKECQIAALMVLSAKDPSNIIWKANLAFRLTEKGRHEEAVAIYEQITDRADTTYDIYAYYGSSLKSLGLYQKAIPMLAKALAINPALMDTTHELAASLIEVGQSEEAMSIVAEFTKKYPDAENYFRDLFVNVTAKQTAESL